MFCTRLYLSIYLILNAPRLPTSETANLNDETWSKSSWELMVILKSWTPTSCRCRTRRDIIVTDILKSCMSRVRVVRRATHPLANVDKLPRR